MSSETPQSLSYTMHNNSGTETIILIHGGFSSNKEWDQILPAISEKYHILIPDLPGHGASSHVPFSVEQSAKLILDLISSLAHNGRAHIVGFSLGAHVAACAAEIAAPGQVSSLVATGYNSFATPKMLVPILVPVVYVLSHFVIGLTDPRAQWNAWVTGTCSFALAGAVVRTLCDGREVGEISTRSLIIAATGGVLLPKDKVDSARELFEVVAGGANGGSRVVQNRGVNHPWHVSDPKLFSETLLAWIEGRELPSAFEDVESRRSNCRFRNIEIERRCQPHNGSTNQDVCWTAVCLHTTDPYEPTLFQMLISECLQCDTVSAPLATFSLSRCFSTTSPSFDWLRPKFQEKSKSPKGRPHVATGGSTRGTTVVWGDFGLRMKDHDRRMPASALKIAEETIKRRLRGMNYKLYKRVSANVGVYTKGNEQRMGKGKGKFDYWTVRLPVSRVVFELKGDVHEKIAREAFRLAGHKLPGLWEFVNKDDPPVVGITKLGNGVTLDTLKRARRNPSLGTDDLASPPKSASSSSDPTQ
ncbi:unnamed protein product [Penicillium salamii]|uniref:AB hydrolase-1 domain-containing protein n=1 Tax=Penicillium salamii TaxID=1612424 RepID=A0A9W4IJJ8_9EURO|nr:unnamed protein product [Penicillium salamii]